MKLVKLSFPGRCTSLVLLVFFCISIENSTSNTQNQDAIFYQSHNHRLYVEAKKLIADLQFDEAESKLDSLLNLNPKSYLAYYQLGVIYSQKENYHKLAENYFLKSIELNKKFADAYFELGMLYKKCPSLKNDAILMLDKAVKYNKHCKDAYYHRALLIMQYKGYLAGLKNLEELLLIDPFHKDSYKIYKRVGIAFHQFKRMNDFYSKLLKHDNTIPQFQLDLVNILYRWNKFDDAIELLAQLNASNPAYCTSLQKIYEARIRFGLGQDTLATNLYFNGIDLVATEEEANDIFSDLIFLVSNDEYDEFIYGKLSEKKDFFHRFWKSRDLTLTTLFNERIPEHFHRLRYARKHNRIYPEIESLDFFLNDFLEPQERNSLLPPIISQYGATKGIKVQQEIDDMGIIYIRHGKPDAFAILIDQAAQSNLSVCYFEKFNRPKMIFNFYIPGARDSRGGSRGDGWRLRLTPVYPKEAASLDARYFSSHKSGQLINETINNISLATSTETSKFEPEAQLFEIPFCYYSYKGEEEKEKFYIYYKLPDEAFPDQNIKQSYLLHHEIVIFNSLWQEVRRFTTIDSTPNISTDEFEYDQKKYCSILEPGPYYVGIKLKNTQNAKEGHLRFGLSIPSSYKPGLKLTSIMLGNFTTNYPDLMNRILTNSISQNLVPNINRIFKVNEPIVVYFEIYNLEFDEDNATRFSIIIDITQLERQRSSISHIFNSFKEIVNLDSESEYKMSIQNDHSGNRSDEFINRTILLSDYPPGQYKLAIRINDKVSNTEIMNEIEFEITK
ncbi:MAG: hypothetical protein ACOY90_22510 [Candidatus Zhuqueibacterota bacterium]